MNLSLIIKNSLRLFSVICSSIILLLLIDTLFSIQPGKLSQKTSLSLAMQPLQTEHTQIQTNRNAIVQSETGTSAGSLIALTNVRTANIHQFALLESLQRFANQSSIQTARSTAINPYLLADYAAQCKAYMGTVPEFSCNGNTNVAESKVLTVDVTQGICPHLGNDEDCVLGGTVEGRLITPTDAPAGAEVTVLFSCRKYDALTPEGRFDDIAVIQHDSTTGNTCWFQSPAVFAFDKNGNFHFDELGYVVYQDFSGDSVPSPMSFGAENFWLHPYQPADEIGADYVSDMRNGRRGTVASMDCQRCHDADPFVWSPYLATIHEINGSTPPEGWHPLGNYVSGSFGLFNADGKVRQQARRLSLTNPNNPCSGCHNFGENTMSSKDATPVAGHGGQVVHFLEILQEDMDKNRSWMPPSNSPGFSTMTTTTKQLLHECAQQIAEESAGCTKELPGPTKRANVKIAIVSEPTTLVAGHVVRYTLLLSNQGMYTVADTATNLKLVDILPAGLLPQQLSEGCTSDTVGSIATVNCEVGDLTDGQQKIFTITAIVTTTGIADTVTNNVKVQATGEINLSTIAAASIHHVRRNVDLSINQNSLLTPIANANPPAFKMKTSLTTSNSGPAVASNVILTQSLPTGAVFDANLSSLRCAESGGVVQCKLGELDDGKSSTINIFAMVNATQGPFFASTVMIATDSPDSNPSNNALQAVLIDRSAVQEEFLPLITNSGSLGADLVVKSIQVTAATAEVVIQNIGDKPVNSEDGFWVDLYINPSSPPTGVNQTIQDLKSNGLVWGVFSPTLRLNPGQEYTLRFADLYYVQKNSSVPPRINVGSKIYVQVDSANIDSDFGGVVESHESMGGDYNNIALISLSESVSTDAWSLVSIATASHNGQNNSVSR